MLQKVLALVEIETVEEMSEKKGWAGAWAERGNRPHSITMYSHKRIMVNVMPYDERDLFIFSIFCIY